VYVEVADERRVGALELSELLPPHAQSSPVSTEPEALLDQIASDPERFLAQRPPTAVLNEAELVFFVSGRIFQLADLYRDAVDRGVIDLLPRLAWVMERAGLHTAAMARAEEAVERLPDNAEAHFVHAYLLGQSETSDRAQLARIRSGFSRALELDPAFVGPSDVSAARVRAQVRELDRQLPLRDEL